MAPHREEPSARAILDHRYARGEITRQEYEVIRRDIEAVGDERRA